jgi:hypothetical protein
MDSKLYVFAKGDIGGFDAGAHLDWQAFGAPDSNSTTGFLALSAIAIFQSMTNPVARFTTSP